MQPGAFAISSGACGATIMRRTHVRPMARGRLTAPPASVWRAAHSLKSSAAALGARHVSQCCEELEALARDNGILPSEAILAALETELTAATDELKALAGAEQRVV